jgi:peptidoglycan/xylan/chitin deacetylase (PgdA/CDA1 family)
VPIERREFLRLAGAAATAATAAGLAGCTNTDTGTGQAGGPPGGTPSSNGPRSNSPGSNGSGSSAASSPTATASPGDDASTPPARPLGPQVVHGPRNRPLVALTFHGQGPISIAEALLAEAEHAQAHVSVLAVGTWLEQYPQIARRILSGGHDLGNHTMHHLDIAAMDASAAYAEITGCARQLRTLTGSEGRWFRPSQTQYATPLIEREARKAGYRTCVSYDVDSLDYTDPGPDAVVATVLAKTRPGSIVSLHFGHEGTVTALPAILRGLTRRNLRPVTLTSLLA